MNVITEICLQDCQSQSLCHINHVQIGCATGFTLIQLVRKHSWVVWCRHSLFARASTVLAVVREVQKTSRLRGTVYFCGRAEWGQHGSSAVISSQNDSWKGVCDGGKVGVGGGGVEVEGGWEELVLAPKSIARELRFGVFSCGK